MMRDLFIMFWGAILASSWWAFGIALYNGSGIGDWYFAVKTLLVMLVVGSFLTLVFTIETIGKAIVRSWDKD